MSRFLVREVPYAIYVNGVDGSANNALSCANSASLNPTAAITVESWFIPMGDRKAFILYDNSESGASLSPVIIINANGSVSWFSTIGGSARNLTGTSLRVRWNEPNFFQGTYTGSAINMFLNGSKFSQETTGISGSIGTNTGRTRWGSYYSGGAGLTMRGLLWGLRVYSVGCSLAEHQDRYYKNETSPSLQGAIALDGVLLEGSGSTSEDATTNENTITIGASASWSPSTPFKLRQASSSRTVSAARDASSARSDA